MRKVSEPVKNNSPNEVLKAAYIGAAATLSAAIIGGIFLLISKSANQSSVSPTPPPVSIASATTQLQSTFSSVSSTPTSAQYSFPNVQGTFEGVLQYETVRGTPYSSSLGSPLLELFITQQSQQHFGGKCSLATIECSIQNGIVDTNDNIQFSINNVMDPTGNSVTMTLKGTTMSGGWQGSFSDTDSNQGKWSVRNSNPLP